MQLESSGCLTYLASGLLPTGRGRRRIWGCYYQDSSFFDLTLTMHPPGLPW